MQETGNAKIEKALFYLVLIFSCLAYIGYYFYARRNGVPLLISYSRSNQAMMEYNPPFVMFFRFGKDVCVALLLFVEMFTMNRTVRVKIFIAMLFLAIYGTAISLLNDAPLNTIISGYRMILFFSAFAMFFNSKYKLYISLKTFLRLITVLLLINTIIAAIQAFDVLGFDFMRIGQESYRFMGLFPAGAAFAFYSFGVALSAYIIDEHTKVYHKNCMMIFIISFIGCYLSGTRSSMINLLIVLFIYLVNRSGIKRLQKIFVLMFLAFPVVVYIIQFATNWANRGSIFENALEGGRFSIFMNSIFGQSTVNIVLGNGIGAGSNSATEFNRLVSGDLLFLDGTFTTLLYQFGVLGLILSLIFIWRITKKVYCRKGLLDTTLFTGTILLQCLTTNVLEAFALLAMLFVCYYALIEGDKIFCELRAENVNS